MELNNYILARIYLNAYRDIYAILESAGLAYRIIKQPIVVMLAQVEAQVVRLIEAEKQQQLGRPIWAW